MAHIFTLWEFLPYVGGHCPFIGHALGLRLSVLLSCRLEELFLCLNEYSNVRASSVACPTLRLLHITDNSLKDWADVRKFGSMFPMLDTLVMANNNLSSIQDGKDILKRLFPNLRNINLNNSGRSTWRDGLTCRASCFSGCRRDGDHTPSHVTSATTKAFVFVLQQLLVSVGFYLFWVTSAGLFLDS